MNSSFIQLAAVLLLAHLCGDFLLQGWELARKKRKSLLYMALHSLINGAAAYVFLADWKGWLVPLVTAASHFLIDFGRSRLKKRDTQGFFVLDQTLHLTAAGLLVGFYLLPRGIIPGWVTYFPTTALPVIVILNALLLLTCAGGVLMGYFVKPYQEQIKEYYKKLKKDAVEGLTEGGKMIGWLERVLIFVFVLAGQYAGVGFLIAAKSVFRFGELKESENRKEAEYIIIGTFASFLYAILISQLAKALLGSLE